METALAEPAFRAHVANAVKLCGTQAELERRSGIAQQTISWLLLRAEKISVEHAMAIERATDGQISRSQLRPDVWPATEAAE